MLRTIIKIDEVKCNGCGICVAACHEGAIGMVNGKAQLMRDDYCDGLGDCLPTCPTSAISFEKRDTLAYDEEAVKASIASKQKRMFSALPAMQDGASLSNWPIQLQLAPIKADTYHEAELLIAADCTAFAYADIQKEIKHHVTFIACPKLDVASYSEKLTQIFRENTIRSVRVLRMEVPCCGGLSYAVEQALQLCGKKIPYSEMTIARDGIIKG